MALTNPPTTGADGSDARGAPPVSGPPVSGPPVSGPPPTASGGFRRRRLLGSRRRQVVAGVVIAGAVGFLLLEGLNNATEYFRTADQAVADRASLGTRQFRIEGTVGSDVRETGGVTTFSITANDVTVPVIDSREPPQLFKPGIPVVLEGHWSGTVFQSSLVMVKHTASYVASHPDRLKSQLPATTVAGPGSIP